jgi:hypothetical protein
MFIGNNQGVEGIYASGRESALTLDGMAALSHASAKILPNLCLVRVDLRCGSKTVEPLHPSND